MRRQKTAMERAKEKSSRNNFNRNFGDKKETKKAKIDRLKKQIENEKKEWLDFMYFLSKNEQITNQLEFKNCFKDFFKTEVTFNTNHIHIIRGNNGQGKSTFLKNLMEASGCGIMPSNDLRFKMTSNNKECANSLNYNSYLSPYKLEEGNIFGTKLFYDRLNVSNNLSLYTDFTVSYFNQKDGMNIIYENMENMSNGERKISGINTFFTRLKEFKALDKTKIDKGINLMVFMDEPESGLSIELQEEFYTRVKYYLKTYQKLFENKITLTFFIVSHSFIWKNEKDITIHNINGFKLTQQEHKKEHKGIFV